MHDSNQLLRQEILAMAENDLSVRQELITDGSLTNQGYHPRMEVVNKSNAARLAKIIEKHGWPGESLIGEDGAEAAWLVAQHAIGNPSFMRKCLSLLKKAAAEKEVPEWQAAMLEDRIRMYEGRPQVYGSQFQPNENGEFVPYTIENPETVNERRSSVGLNTLEERITELREQNMREKTPLHPNWEKRYERWLRAVGWRER
jgi:hypothetical protein